MHAVIEKDAQHSHSRYCTVKGTALPPIPRKQRHYALEEATVLEQPRENP